MGRKQERIKRKLEENPIQKCNEIQRKFYPELFQKFANTKDPRNQSYISYTNKIMLGTMYYKGIAGITSMQSMTYEFNNQMISENLTAYMGEKSYGYLPHHVTENEYLERLDPNELQNIQQDIVYHMIRRKSFSEARFKNKWLVIVDGTQLYSGRRKLNDKCLQRVHNKGTDKEIISYHIDVLEAKIYFGENLIASMASEFIENNGKDAERQKTMSLEEIKQDCETKAFKRMAEKLHERFPRLPMILLMDSLYASEPVLELCRKYKWDFIIRYKKGSIPSIAEEYEAIPEKDTAGYAQYINNIDYKGSPLNVLKYRENTVKKGEIIKTEFQWLTNINITMKNAEKIAAVGRKRWKIENEGFNRQKNWQGDITHTCSWNDIAQKNHYLMIQIADFLKQLYEYYYLKKEGIKKKQKNISSDLLQSLGQRPAREDISLEMETHSVTTN